jgi:hypothetical protein
MIFTSSYEQSIFSRISFARRPRRTFLPVLEQKAKAANRILADFASFAAFRL